jgi:hypothetical protein
MSATLSLSFSEVVWSIEHRFKHEVGFVARLHGVLIRDGRLGVMARASLHGAALLLELGASALLAVELLFNLALGYGRPFSLLSETVFRSGGSCYRMASAVRIPVQE